MQPDTIVRLRSMTKPITSVAVMLLYEQGMFQLYDHVSKYIPEFKDVTVLSKATPSGPERVEPEREMTILDLLRHTSGLTTVWDPAVGDVYRQANLEGEQPAGVGAEAYSAAAGCSAWYPLDI